MTQLLMAIIWLGHGDQGQSDETELKHIRVSHPLISPVRNRDAARGSTDLEDQAHIPKVTNWNGTQGKGSFCLHKRVGV